MRKDKEKVLDEVWTEDRVKSFLDVRSHDEVERDFHMLLKAYQSMRDEDFAKFLNFFTGAGHNINATNPAGETVLSIVCKHHNSGAYADLLKQAGAA